MDYGRKPGAMVRGKNNLRRLTVATLALAGAVLFAGTAMAQTGYIGILGGGPVYKRNLTNVRELKKAGFNELIVWSVEVGATGDLNLNGEFPLTSARNPSPLIYTNSPRSSS